jgi:hypothetical protein
MSVSEAARSGVQALLDGGMGAKYSAAVEPRIERVRKRAVCSSPKCEALPWA